MRLAVIAITCLTLAACNSGRSAENETAVANFVPPATQRPAPIAGQAQTTPLTAYVGQYPDQPVDGVNFFDRTEVATALDGAVTDAKLRRAIVNNAGPRTPIFQAGTRVATWGCEAHDCGDHNWTLLVDPASGKGEVCVHEGGATRWYAGGPAETRPGDCPSQTSATQGAK